MGTAEYDYKSEKHSGSQLSHLTSFTENLDDLRIYLQELFSALLKGDHHIQFSNS
jgi:hypothetical protein